MSLSYAILLPGPSLSEFANSVGTDIPSDVQFVAINRKDHIEAELAKIGRNVDHWCVVSESEILDQSSKIQAFLDDDRRGNFITRAAVLPARAAVLPRMVMADELFILLDEWFRKRTGLSADGHINSLFFLLHFLAESSPRCKAIYLFGCDGVSGPRSTTQYFRQAEFYAHHRLDVSNLWADMLTFDSHWHASVRDLIVGRRLPAPTIVNANPQSHYRSFLKVAVKDAVSLMSPETALERRGMKTSAFKDTMNEVWIRTELLALAQRLEELSAVPQAPLPRYIEVVDVRGNYNIVRAGQRFYAINQSVGKVDVRVGPQALTERFQPDDLMVAETLDEARAAADLRILQRRPAGEATQIVAICGHYNIVRAGERFYAINQALGPVDVSVSPQILTERYGPDDLIAADTLDAALAAVEPKVLSRRLTMRKKLARGVYSLLGSIRARDSAQSAPAVQPARSIVAAWTHVDIEAAIERIKVREDLATLVKAESIALELGVAEGWLSEKLLNRSRLAHLYSVDMYAGDRGHGIDQYWRAVKRLDVYRARNSLLRMRFDEALTLFPDNYFDFIYVDGYAHTGEEGGETFRQWLPKLKSGGVFAGDDYSPAWPLVVDAVDRFVAENGFKLYVINCLPGNESTTPFPSWLVVKDIH